MARWRQVYNEEKDKYELVPIDESARVRGAVQGSAIHGDIQSFVSPVDGTVISDRKQLREHNKRNNVVSAAEFSDEYYARKAEERRRSMSGEYSRQEQLERKREIYESWVHHERK